MDRRNPLATLLACRTTALLLCAASSLTPTIVEARGTAAGATIVSTATATYLLNGAPMATGAPPASIRVQEVIDVIAQPGSGERAPASRGDSGRALPFVLTNLGNGHERFALKLRTALDGDSFDPSCARVVLDSNGNGVFDPSTDAAHISDANDPGLQPDQSLTVFAVCDLPEQLADGGNGSVALDAVAVSGSGLPGTSLPDVGDAGTDAVIGATGGRTTVLHGFVLVDGVPTLVKSQQVVDPTGGTSPIAGARITYALVASIGRGSALEAVIADPIPTGTTYESGSMRLDGAPLTDIADADAGSFDGRRVEVQLGTLAAEAPRTVTFSVKVDQR